MHSKEDQATALRLCHIHNQVMATGNMDTNMAKSSGVVSKLSKLTDI